MTLDITPEPIDKAIANAALEGDVVSLRALADRLDERGFDLDADGIREALENGDVASAVFLALPWSI